MLILHCPLECAISNVISTLVWTSRHPCETRNSLHESQPLISSHILPLSLSVQSVCVRQVELRRAFGRIPVTFSGGSFSVVVSGQSAFLR